MQFIRNILNKLLARAEKIPFRKRSSGYAGIAVILFVIVLSGYILAGVLRGLSVPIQTATVLEYESSAGYYASGYIVREETVLTSASPITSLVLSEGQMASTGEPVAMGYTSGDAQSRQTQIAHLEEQLSQLTYAGSTALAVFDQATLDAHIRQELLDMAVTLGKGRMDDVSQSAPRLKGLVLRRMADEQDVLAMQQHISALQSEIARLKQESSGNVTVIRAPHAGYFSGTTDGFESTLTPASITAMSPSEVENLSPGAQPAGAVGKIITGDRWYYLTTIPASEQTQIAVGDKVTVNFSQELAGSVSMTVSFVGDEENGKCTLILWAERFLQEMTLVRHQSADILFRSYDGLRVPKEAIHVLEDGSVGVYVLESAICNWKSVEILHDNGETYLVKLDKSSTDHLWPGDEVILSGEDDLFDGKVIY